MHRAMALLSCVVPSPRAFLWFDNSLRVSSTGSSLVIIMGLIFIVLLHQFYILKLKQEAYLVDHWLSLRGGVKTSAITPLWPPVVINIERSGVHGALARWGCTWWKTLMLQKSKYISPKHDKMFYHSCLQSPVSPPRPCSPSHFLIPIVVHKMIKIKSNLQIGRSHVLRIFY